MTRRFLVLAIAFALVVPALAAAQNQVRPRQRRAAIGIARMVRARQIVRRIRRADANHDGKVTRDEWRGRAAMFDRLDRDHDGAIGAADVPAPVRARMRFQRMDANHDGKITRDEWRGPAERFDRLDRNHDGMLTKEDRRIRSPRTEG